MSKLHCWATGLALIILAGCSTSKDGRPSSSTSTKEYSGVQFQIPSPEVWGGEVRCNEADCKLALVEHKKGLLAVYRIDKNGATLLDKHHLAYHPDDAIWLHDTKVVAAVEITKSLEVFDLINEKLVHKQQIPLEFQPRNVILLSSINGLTQLLATPYSGTSVAFIYLDDNSNGVHVKHEKWCKAPWNPMRVKTNIKQMGFGVVAACRGDENVIFVPEKTSPDDKNNIKNLGVFPQIPSMAAIDPTGEWIYVALETGEKNARINLQTGQIQWIASSVAGSMAVRLMPDGTVVWAEDRRLKLDRLDSNGNIVESRWHKTSGLSTSLQLIDVDRDGVLDVVVLNSSGSQSDVILGPLWENGQFKD